MAITFDDEEFDTTVPVHPALDVANDVLYPTFRTDAWCTFWIFSKTGKQAHFHG